MCVNVDLLILKYLMTLQLFIIRTLSIISLKLSKEDQIRLSFTLNKLFICINKLQNVSVWFRFELSFYKKSTNRSFQNTFRVHACTQHTKLITFASKNEETDKVSILPGNYSANRQFVKRLFFISNQHLQLTNWKIPTELALSPLKV